MIVETENLKTIEEVGAFFADKLKIKRAYFPVLMQRGKVQATTVKIDNRLYFVINPDADDWDIKVEVKATKK